MSLPKINYPLFDVTIPSNSKTVKLRPFLVKEEKILLTAQTTGDPKDTVMAIKQVVNNCLIDEVNIDDLTTFDLEFLFIKLRARSVNNVVDVTYNDPEDEQQYTLKIDLDKVAIIKDERHNPTIEITDDMGIILRYPNTDMLSSLDKVTSEVDVYFEVIKYCIDKIYDGDSVYEARESTNEELNEFVSSLGVNTFKQIQTFLETMPRLFYEATYTNSLGNERKVVLQNLNDFFMLG